MKKPNKTLPALGVGRSVVKYHAHALTMFAVFWSLPSGLVILGLVLEIQDHTSGLTEALGKPLTVGHIARWCFFVGILAIHLWSIIGAIYYWFTERGRKVTVLKGGANTVD